MVDIKTTQCFLLSDGSICSGLLQEAITQKFSLVTSKSRVIREVWRSVSGKIVPVPFFPPFSGQVGQGRQGSGWDGDQLWSQLLGVQDAGCEPWLWRQENRGMILTARGAGEWMESLVMLRRVGDLCGYTEAPLRKRKGRALCLGERNKEDCGPRALELYYQSH